MPILLVLALAATAATGAAAAAAASADTSYTRNVAIVVYDGVEVLDFAGPAEVFAVAGGEGSHKERRAFRVYTVGPTRAPIKSQGFITVVPEFSIDDAPKPDIVVIPGGNSGELTGNPAFMKWATREASSRITLTVCSGAFVPGRAGLLDGLPVTTWYGAIDRLKAAAPKANVQHGRRFIDNGSIITTAGVSAGIDGSLHLVARLLGREVADRTARYMEYHWTPEPYLAREYVPGNPSAR